MYDNLDKENKKSESLLEKPLTTQFIEKRSDIDREVILMAHFDYYKQILPT